MSQKYKQFFEIRGNFPLISSNFPCFILSYSLFPLFLYFLYLNSPHSFTSPLPERIIRVKGRFLLFLGCFHPYLCISHSDGPGSDGENIPIINMNVKTMQRNEKTDIDKSLKK